MPSAAVVARLHPNQRDSFLRLCDRLPDHLRDITFDLHGDGWYPEVIQELSDNLCDFPDVLSISKTGFGSCAFLPLEISIPRDSTPVSSSPYRLSYVVGKNNEVILDQYLAANLSRPSTSPHASPLVVVPERDSSTRVTVNYKKLY